MWFAANSRVGDIMDAFCACTLFGVFMGSPNAVIGFYDGRTFCNASADHGGNFQKLAPHETSAIARLASLSRAGV
jgi:hypothetical protein